MARREFLQLAHTFDPKKHGIGGWYLSEKLDGMRAYWDGGFTRGILTSSIPFANTTKDYRRITPPRSTGLWSRYGKPIAAPEWFLDQLPENLPLDGELYAGRGNFQKLMSTVKKFDPVTSEWKDVTYKVFDIPSDKLMFLDGNISVPHWKAELDLESYAPSGRTKVLSFREVYARLQKMPESKIWQYVEQIRLPMQTSEAEEAIENILDTVTVNGGEGVVLRNPSSYWYPSRNNDLLKIKKWLDDEALVTGYVWGHGKLEGLMGALVVRWHGKTFELSGFTEAERVLSSRDGGRAYGEPGEEVSTVKVLNVQFPVGSIVTFKYRELTDSGIPKEARFWRK
jgi:DNA ligase-1